MGWHVAGGERQGEGDGTLPAVSVVGRGWHIAGRE